MISYKPLYETMKKRGVTTYKLINQYGISRSLVDRLKHNKPITTVTLNDLCTFLDARVEEIMVYIKDEKKQDSEEKNTACNQHGGVLK